jgi:putative transposase
LIEVCTETAEEAIAVWQEVRGEEDVWGEFRRMQQVRLQWFVEQSLRDAMERKIGVGWYVRSDGRQGYRNGSYTRTLVTPYGTIEIQVPRLREGRYEHGLFDERGLLTARAREMVLETYLAGVSTRRVGEVLSETLGYEVSAGTVSAICKGLDKLVRAFWRRELGDEWKYLVLDGVVVKNRSVTGAEKRVILVAVGVRADGRKEILSFHQAESEAEVCWETFLEDLVGRGLKGRNLEMVTTDGSPGLVAAVKTVWPYVARQRCWVHKLRNMAAVMKRKNQKACLDGAKLIYLAPSQLEARRRFRLWRDRWMKEEPKAVACLEKDIGEMLEFLALPEKDRVMMRTTNRIERVFREVRRRTRTISCFTNRRSVDRMLFAILAYQNRRWGAPCRSAAFTHNA